MVFVFATKTHNVAWIFKPIMPPKKWKVVRRRCAAIASHSIDRHVPLGWEGDLERNGFVIVPLYNHRFSILYSEWYERLVDDVKQRCRELFQVIDGGK